MQRRSFFCQSITGAPIPACSITVYLAGTLTKATIYSDLAGSTTLGNPITAGSDGTYAYYAANGRYTEVLSASGFTFGAAQTQDFILNDPFVAASPAAATGSYLNASASCSNITNPVTGGTWCYDTGVGDVKVYDGSVFQGTTAQRYPITQTNNGTYTDNYAVFGFNPGAYKPPLGGGDTTIPSFVIGLEDKFWNSELSKNTFEWYVNYQSADHTTTTNFRPFFTAVARDLNADHRALVVLDVGDSGGKARTVAGATTLWETDTAKTQYSQPVGVNLAGSSPAGIGASLAVKPPDVNSQGITVRGLNGQIGAELIVQDSNAASLAAIGPGGLVLGAPSGGDLGVGTLNASAYYVQGTAFASMVLTNASGTRTNVPHMVQDTVTLAGGTAGVALAGAAAFTNSTSYTCVCDNDSAVLACRVVQNGGNGFTLSSGAGTDVVRFICVGS